MFHLFAALSIPECHFGCHFGNDCTAAIPDLVVERTKPAKKAGMGT